MIQRFYRRNRKAKRLQGLEQSSAIVVQKYMKGYLVRKQIMKELAFHKIDQMHSEFMPMNQILKENLQVKLKKAWRSFKEEKAKKAKKV